MTIKIFRLCNKKTPSYAGLSSNSKPFSNCQATYQEEIYLFAVRIIKQCFAQSGRTDRLDPPPPVRFRSLFKDSRPPFHDERTFEGIILVF